MNITRSQSFEGVNLHYAAQCSDRTAQRVIFHVRGLDTASASIQAHGVWATAVVTIKHSNEINGPWTAVTGLATLTNSAPNSDPFSICANYLLAEVTTAEGSDVFASISFNGKGS